MERGLLVDLLGEDPRVRVDMREAIEVSVPSDTGNPLQSHATRVSHRKEVSPEGVSHQRPPLMPITTGTIMGRRRWVVPTHLPTILRAF